MPENDYYRHGPHAIERREPLVNRFYDEVARAEADIRAERAARADKLSSIAVTLSSLCVDTDVVVDVLRVLSEEARKSRMVHTNDLDALNEALGYIGGVGQEPADQSEGTASAKRINEARLPVRCDFGGTCNREHGAQCAAVCRRMRGEA